MIKYVVRTLLVSAACMVAAAPSYAYLDPGTGSIILQSILASIAVAVGVMRFYWQQCKQFFAGLFGLRTASRSQDNDHVGAESELKPDP